jgi:hypothetical protein
MPNMCEARFACCQARPSEVPATTCLPIGIDLLTNKNSEQTDQRYEGRRRGADIQKAVNHADQNTGYE